MRLLLLLLFLALTTPALASDGVLEINQTCATQTGCFAGDTAGWPVTITVPGSYRLTSNLRLSISLGGSQSENFIDVLADDVSIDLGGFQISCGRFLLEGSCSGAGSGVFVLGNSVNTGTSVKNGSIRGMATSGISLGKRAHVSHLQSELNGQDGISAGGDSTISGNTVFGNGDNGIAADDDSTISGNTVNGNGDNGIVVGRDSTVSGNTANRNGGYGMLASSGGANISGNTVNENGDRGIFAGNGSIVSGNTANGNQDIGIFAKNSIVSGNTANGNGGDGIFAENAVVSGNTANRNGGDGIQVVIDSLVANNTCDANTGAGVHATGSGNRIDGNTATDNTAAQFDVDVGGNLVIRNSAAGGGPNFSQVVAGNTKGEVLDSTGPGGTITETTSAWANFSF